MASRDLFKITTIVVGRVDLEELMELELQITPQVKQVVYMVEGNLARGMAPGTVTRALAL